MTTVVYGVMYKPDGMVVSVEGDLTDDARFVWPEPYTNKTADYWSADRDEAERVVTYLNREQ